MLKYFPIRYLGVLGRLNVFFPCVKGLTPEEYPAGTWGKPILRTAVRGISPLSNKGVLEHTHMSDDQVQVRSKAKKDQRYRCTICHKAGQTIGYNAVHCHWDRIHKENGHPSSRKFRDKYVEVAAPGVIVEDKGADENEAMEDTEEDDSPKEERQPTTSSNSPAISTRKPKQRKEKRGINELLNDQNGQQPPPQNGPPNSGEVEQQSPHHHEAWAREMDQRRRAQQQAAHHQQQLPPQHYYAPPPLHHPIQNGHHPHHLPPSHHPNHNEAMDRNNHERIEEERHRMAAVIAAANASQLGGHPAMGREDIDRHVKRDAGAGIKGLLNDDHPHMHHVAQQHHHTLHHLQLQEQHHIENQWENILDRMGQRLVRAEETIMLLTHRCNALSEANQHLGQLLTGFDANLSNLNGLVNEYMLRGRPSESSPQQQPNGANPAPAVAAAALAGLNPPSPAQSQGGNDGNAPRV
ncbi:hypothetical protein LEN26_020185 [Aphanomyces euteiches]|nr:hypothetical protein LEN26_020185 [Aphanomyces euteiches]